MFRLLIIALMLSYPLLVGFFFSVLDDIDIVSIRDLQLREEGGKHILDATVIIRNTSKKTLKLLDGEFDLALLTKDNTDISLGKVAAQDILLDIGDDGTITDTIVLLSIDLGTKSHIQSLYDTIVATAAIPLFEPKPTIPLHFQAHFSLALQSTQAWNYSNGIEIDWVVTPEVERQVLIHFLQAISQGKFVPPTPVPDTPTKSSSGTHSTK